MWRSERCVRWRRATGKRMTREVQRERRMCSSEAVNRGYGLVEGELRVSRIDRVGIYSMVGSYGTIAALDC